MWLCLCPSSLVFSYAKLSNEFVGIRIVGKHKHFHLKVLGEENFDRLFGGLYARAVAIIVDYNFARKPAQQLHCSAVNAVPKLATTLRTPN